MAIIHEIAHGLGALRDTTSKTLDDGFLHRLNPDRVETPFGWFLAGSLRNSPSDGFADPVTDAWIAHPRVAKSGGQCGLDPTLSQLALSDPKHSSRPEVYHPGSCSRLAKNTGAIALQRGHHRTGAIRFPGNISPDRFGKRSESLDTPLQTWRAQAPLESMRGDGADEDWLGSLLVASCHGLRKEWEIPTGWDFMVDEFRGSKAAPALHAASD